MRRLLTLLAALAILAALPSLSLADATHVVRKGDTLGKIARAYRVPVAKIREANGLEGTRITPGTKLVLPGGVAHSKRRKARSGVRGGDAVLASSSVEGHPAGEWKPPTEAELAELARAPKAVETAEAAPPAAAASEVGATAAAEPGNADDSIKARLLRVARRMLEVPYRYGGSTLWGLDCSGFVQKAFAFLDLELPHSARAQFREGITISKDELSAGDLVFFRSRSKYASHVGIYLGENRFIHASGHDRKVTIDNLDEPYYMKHYLGARRLLVEGEYVPN